MPEALQFALDLGAGLLAPARHVARKLHADGIATGALAACDQNEACCACGVGRAALTAAEQACHIDHGRRISASNRPLVPGAGRDRVLRDAFAIVERDTELVHGAGIASGSRFFVPLA